MTFGAPAALTLVIAPAALLLLWLVRLAERRLDLRRIARRRTVPLRERFRFGGELSFWLFQIIALALLILALARPLATTTVPQRAGLDVVVLQDASASMRVMDVSRATAPREPGRAVARDRWQRSMEFLRALGDALSWHSDRIALTAFAHIAAPQIRLTRDPNTLFFFLDHLYEQPPFRLEDETTWDTNLELGLAWGLRIIEKDEEIHGRSPNAKLFVVLSDGETWSGEVAKAIVAASQRGIPVFAVGVGTLGGGPLPSVAPAPGEPAEAPGVSRLDRDGLQRTAAQGQGQYFELDRDGDRYIANAIVSAGRRLAPPVGLQEIADELYWWFVAAAAAFSLAGLMLLNRPTELAIVFGAGLVAAGLIGPLLS